MDNDKKPVQDGGGNVNASDRPATDVTKPSTANERDLEQAGKDKK